MYKPPIVLLCTYLSMNFCFAATNINESNPQASTIIDMMKNENSSEKITLTQDEYNAFKKFLKNNISNKENIKSKNKTKDEDYIQSINNYLKNGYYTIQPNDTLISIAEKFHINVNDIIKTNNILEINKIKVGQKIILADIIKPKNYTVNFGDSLLGISKKFNVNINDLIKINNLNSRDLIKAGDVLKLPR
ncbi:LysM peptidoglycan-binding domain-containing protein [Acinetobacter lactucae]|uniref:LysM peptidoglycan-binding domain-containing protein n=1 Tax=Acinetobacter lactucae TaxID=1785128 RepID=UPI00358DD07E